MLTHLYIVVGLNGLEPSTSRLSGVRSNLLSYKPVMNVSGSGPEDWIEADEIQKVK